MKNSIAKKIAHSVRAACVVSMRSGGGVSRVGGGPSDLPLLLHEHHLRPEPAGLHSTVRLLRQHHLRARPGLWDAHVQSAEAGAGLVGCSGVQGWLAIGLWDVHIPSAEAGQGWLAVAACRVGSL